jgi:hypothetical protein
MMVEKKTLRRMYDPSTGLKYHPTHCVGFLFIRKKLDSDFQNIRIKRAKAKRSGQASKQWPKEYFENDNTSFF